MPGEGTVQTRSASCTCTDWWSPGHIGKELHSDNKNAEEFPLRLENSDNDPDAAKRVVRLTFGMLARACIDVAHWKQMSHRPTKKKAEGYLAKVGLGAKVADGIIAGVWSGEDIQDLLPCMLKEHRNHMVGLDRFVITPMHQNALGVEKALIQQTEPLFVRSQNTASNMNWRKFYADLTAYNKKMVRSSIDWCKPMPFSTKDKQKLGTAGWTSENYMAFTRLSLVYHSPLEDDHMQVQDDFGANTFAAFKSMRVLWLCTMSHMFCDEKVPSGKIDDFIRLFLSACVKLHKECLEAKAGRRRGRKRGRREDDGEGSDGGEGAGENAGSASATSKAFYEGKSNFFSLLNVKETVEEFGSLRDLWEGYMESYFQVVKGELTSFRHDDDFMVTILTKILRTSFLAHMNQGNPYSETKEQARTLDFNVYLGTCDVSAALNDDKKFPSGVVVDDKLYLCFGRGGRSEDRSVSLVELQFDDTNGKWRYNLWYAPVCANAAQDAPTKMSREEVLGRASDFFVLLPEFVVGCDTPHVHTVLCKSWKLRDECGNFRLLLPREDGQNNA